MTEPSSRPRFGIWISPAVLGGVMCFAGLLLVWFPPLLTAALGLELLAAAFWWWARSAADAAEQIPRWAWLRRPAAALWLAAGCHAVLQAPHLGGLAFGRPAGEALRWLQAAAIVWAGLELLAALPLERPFSDRPGPLRGVGPWLPVIVPTAGFLVLWRQSAHWVAQPGVRDVALLLLVVTALVATLRAFSRQRWIASLRWLCVADGSLAAVLVGLHVVRPEVSLLLWIATFGGRAALLAGELRGAAPRRRPLLHALWRISGWLALASLSWVLLVALAFGRSGTSSRPYAVMIAGTVALGAWVTVRRLVEAPERRAIVRREAALPLTQVMALLTLAIGPIAVALAWWTGFEASWPGSTLALLPAALGGGFGWWHERSVLATIGPLGQRAGQNARGLAHAAFGLLLWVEQRAVRIAHAMGRAVLAPGRDLHTGDAQEYLLFLVGLSVLALVLPLLE